ATDWIDSQFTFVVLPFTARGLAPARKHSRMFQGWGRSHPHLKRIHVASLAPHAPEHLSLDWIVSHAENRMTIFGQRNRDDEFGNAFDEFLGTVQRIDYPDSSARQSLAVVGGFFREPPIVGEAAAEQMFDFVVSVKIRGRDRIIFTFLVNLKTTVPEIAFE